MKQKQVNNLITRQLEELTRRMNMDKVSMMEMKKEHEMALHKMQNHVKVFEADKNFA